MPPNHRIKSIAVSKNITVAVFAFTYAQNCSHAHHEAEEEVDGDEKEEVNSSPVESEVEEPEEGIVESDVEIDDEDVVPPDDAPPQQVGVHYKYRFL